MVVMRPLGSMLRRYRSDMRLASAVADAWMTKWIHRLDPAPQGQADDSANVVDMADRRRRAEGRL